MSSTNTHTSRSHRSAQQWQVLVDEWQASDMSARQFCTERAIGYASFCLWSKRLEQGQFPVNSSASGRRWLSCSDLQLILDGIEVQNAVN